MFNFGKKKEEKNKKEPEPTAKKEEATTAQPENTPRKYEKRVISRTPLLRKKNISWYDGKSEKKVKKDKRKQKTPKLRPSITPGCILILLLGPHSGNRVIFLKQLKNGMLLVTGPKSLNGVPIHRVYQSFVIATSTKVDVSKVPMSHIDNAYFKVEKKRNRKDATKEDEFFKQKPEKETVDPKFAIDQEAVDKVLMTEIAKEPELEGYLRTRFSLGNKDIPHEMVF